MAIAAALGLLLLAGVGEAREYSSQPAGEAMVAESADQPTVAPPPSPAMVSPPPCPVMVAQPCAGVTPQFCDNGGCACPDTCGDCNWHFFTGGIFLQPMNAGVTYAVPINGPITAGSVPVQDGRTAVVNPDFSSGFFIGAGRNFGCGNLLSATYTYFNSRADDSITTATPALESMVMHPSSLDAGTLWLSASASEVIRFNMVDVDYRHVFYCHDGTTADYLWGIRYADLRQSFSSTYEYLINASVDADVNFEGVGPRVGLEAQHQCICRGLFVYGKGAASLLGGDFRAAYNQSNATTLNVADTTLKEARFVPILDLECGIGWEGCGGHVRGSVGYLASAWLNTTKAATFIAGVQANDYSGLDRMFDNTLAFDGFLARLEFTW
ncbi:MAG: Lpg1974 family pore-forming outer membrane protein [Thermoguttaceae bacterium]